MNNILSSRWTKYLTNLHTLQETVDLCCTDLWLGKAFLNVGMMVEVAEETFSSDDSLIISDVSLNTHLAWKIITQMEYKKH